MLIEYKEGRYWSNFRGFLMVNDTRFGLMLSMFAKADLQTIYKSERSRF